MNIIEHKYRNTDNYGTYYMLSDGSAMCRIYGFNNDDEYMVLDSLSVQERARKKGIGTKLQELREKHAKDKGCKYVFLWVVEGSWMHDWYKRRGYVTKQVYDKEDGCVWMKKEFPQE